MFPASGSFNLTDSTWKSVRMRLIILAATAIALGGCSQGWDETSMSSPPGGTGILASGIVAEGDMAVSSVSQLPVRTSAGAVEPYATKTKAAAYEFGSGYRVGSGDRLTIRVAGEPDLTADYLVDGSGNISMPYVQSLPVAGLTTPKIEALITQRLRQGFLRDPQVSTQVTTPRPFYILGEVNGSGGFPYQPGITVQNAIAIAGGYGPRADQRKVLITRKTADGTNTYKVPVTTQVYPGDIIYIRERWF
jgi:polysaccharide export outer membrane protein